jgi:predicted nucleotidyltransferase
MGTKIPKMGTSSKPLMRRRLRRSPTVRVQQKSALRTSLAGALFTSTQQRVLALLFGQPDRTFFTGELFELARSGRGAVQRELAKLTNAALIVVTKIGNQKHFQANRSAPIFHELRSIVLKTVGLVEPIKAALALIRQPIELAFIYGSIAKHTDTASSDVDLLIVSERLSLEDAYATLASAEQAISRKINVTLLTPGEFERRRTDNSPFLTKVLSDQHIDLVGEANGYTAAR